MCTRTPEGTSDYAHPVWAELGVLNFVLMAIEDSNFPVVQRFPQSCRAVSRRADNARTVLVERNVSNFAFMTHWRYVFRRGYRLN